MLNNEDTPKTKSYVSNSDLAAITSDSEHIVRNCTTPSFLTTLHQAELGRESLQEKKVSLNVSLQLRNKGLSCKPTTGQANAPAGNPSYSNPLITMKRKNTMPEMAVQEAKRIYVKQDNPSMQKAAEDALLETFFGGSRNSIPDSKRNHFTF